MLPHSRVRIRILLVALLHTLALVSLAALPADRVVVVRASLDPPSALPTEILPGPHQATE